MIWLALPGSIIVLLLFLHILASFFVGKTLHKEVANIVRKYADVNIHRDKWITLRPASLHAELTLNSGLVMIPGGYTDPDAYIPLLLPLAREGITCFIVPGPGRLAILNRFATDRVINSHTDLKSWILCGHSLGGAVINLYIRNRYKALRDNGINICGLVFLGCYFTEQHSLSAIQLPALSVHGSEDGFAERFKPNEHNLPHDCTIVKIEGGNHGQFAHYGKHLHDNTAKISRQSQQALTQQALLSFIKDRLPA